MEQSKTTIPARSLGNNAMINSIIHQARCNALEEAASFYEQFRCIGNAKDGYSIRPTGLKACGRKKAMADAIRKLKVANA